ncbi:MAG: flagellar assembly protein FlgT [Motiliproteus sp.]|nr:flagellar assembly protein FlgT [Motiliproteus sp.]
MTHLLRFILALIFITLPTLVHALTVEAEGRALITNQDLESARQQALRDASQQALLQAGAFVSSSQTINQGVLSVDNLRVRSVGNLTNVKVIDERVQGSLFILKIRADVDTEESCNSGGNNYLKSAAVAAFPLLDPTQANRGALHDAQQMVSKLISDQLSKQGDLRAMNASHLSVNNALTTAASHQRPNGTVTEALDNFRDLDVQFIVSGVIRDMDMYDPSRTEEGNFFKSIYDSADHRGRQHMRNFGIEVFIHDGFTGALLFNRSYRAGGLWALDGHAKTGFGSAAFLKTDYGQQVNSLVRDVSKDLNKQLRCEPFRARIVQTRGNSVTFNAGAIAGIRPGDKMTVYRKFTFYDQQNNPHVRLENTRHTLVVNEVHPLFAEGKLATDSSRENIQQDDVLLAW